jgi:hypothetical protein
MAQSVRVSDRLYEEASTAATASQRSLAQQVEYWARIGMAAEDAGLTQEALMQLLLRAQHARDRARVAQGRLKASALAALGKAQVRRAKVHLQPIDLARAADDYR